MEAGELACKALDKAVDAVDHSRPEFERESWSTQQADALVTVARTDWPMVTRFALNSKLSWHRSTSVWPTMIAAADPG